jgi:hypothetical protein
MATTGTQITDAGGPGSGPAVKATPLTAVLTLAFLGSLGTGAVTNGFSFIATQGLGYGRMMNLLLALVLGTSYIVGALASGPIVRRLSERGSRLTPRGVLVIVLIVIGLACQLPMAAKVLAPELLEVSLWALIVVFSPMTGILWPFVEGYLSGGRRDRELRTALGRFNIVWSSALVLSFWAMAPLLRDQPFLILSLLGCFQFLMLGLLVWFPSYPPRHVDGHGEPAPESYKPLLTIFRVLLIASYIVLSALSPLLPLVEARLGVDVAWKTPIASVWLFSRVFTFLLFERWHGWHGRWWTPWTGMTLMIVGFAGCVGSPVFGGQSTGWGLWVLIAGLVVVGMGIAMTYYAALYYAMAVGNAEVDAGGKHEAMIGVGYTLGPICGLGGVGLSGGDDDAFRFWVITLITACVIGAVVLGWRLLRRSKSRETPVAPSPH